VSIPAECGKRGDKHRKQFESEGRIDGAARLPIVKPAFRAYLVSCAGHRDHEACEAERIDYYDGEREEEVIEE
jgi:hypothetical protein